MNSKNWILLCVISFAGCRSHDSEGLEKCAYAPVALSDPDVPADQFEKSPRELLGPAKGEFTGKLDGRRVRLRLEPNYAELEALYDGNGHEDCVPNLRAPPTTTIRIEDETGTSREATGRGTLELRLGKLIAGLRFDTNRSDDLGVVLTEAAGDNAEAGQLDGWLTGLASEPLESDWQWSATRDCTGQKECRPQQEIVWGSADLTRAE